MSIIKFSQTYSSYLKDESKLSGSADSISFVTCVQDVVETVTTMNSTNTPITVQGGKTGLCGGAVPCGGHVINMEKFNKVLALRDDGDDYIISLQAGVTVEELNNPKTLNIQLEGEQLALFDKMKKANKHVFLPQPTETSAQIGGIIACNAKGINQAFLSDARQYVERLAVVLASGAVLDVSRGQYSIVGGQCHIDGVLDINFQGQCDNTLSIKVEQEMDLIDLFIGTEGLFGIIVEADIRLKPNFSNLWGVMFFFRQDDTAHNFVADLRQFYDSNRADCQLVAVEYYDNNTLRGMQSFKGKVAKLASVPDISDLYKQCIYVEIAGEEEQLEEVLMQVLEMFMAYNDNEEDSWASVGTLETEKFRLLRHSAPEYVNQQVDIAKLACSDITKVALDYCAPADMLEQTLQLYSNIQQQHGLKTYVFGHIFNNHLHVNIVPTSLDEYQLAIKVSHDVATTIVEWGGAVTYENGIGKIKKSLAQLTGQSSLDVLRTIKQQLDNNDIINRGNVL